MFYDDEDKLYADGQADITNPGNAPDLDDEDETDEDDEDVMPNVPTVSIDSEDVNLWERPWGDPGEVERVQVSFPDAENGYQTDAQEALPLGWVNNAAITLDRADDAVHLTISVGDPRGAFRLTVRRLPDGRLVMHYPHPNDSFQHRPLTVLHEGTYLIG